jgi:hypothetical protein
MRLGFFPLQFDSGRSEDGHDEDFVNRKIELEERKLLVAQRKLESIRLLDELLERVKVNILCKARTWGTSLSHPGHNWTSNEKNQLLFTDFYSGQNDVGFLKLLFLLFSYYLLSRESHYKILESRHHFNLFSPLLF